MPSSSGTGLDEYHHHPHHLNRSYTWSTAMELFLKVLATENATDSLVRVSSTDTTTNIIVNSSPSPPSSATTTLPDMNENSQENNNNNSATTKMSITPAATVLEAGAHHLNPVLVTARQLLDDLLDYPLHHQRNSHPLLSSLLLTPLLALLERFFPFFAGLPTDSFLSSSLDEHTTTNRTNNDANNNGNDDQEEDAMSPLSSSSRRRTSTSTSSFVALENSDGQCPTGLCSAEFVSMMLDPTGQCSEFCSSCVSNFFHKKTSENDEVIVSLPLLRDPRAFEKLIDSMPDFLEDENQEQVDAICDLINCLLNVIMMNSSSSSSLPDFSHLRLSTFTVHFARSSGILAQLFNNCLLLQQHLIQCQQQQQKQQTNNQEEEDFVVTEKCFHNLTNHRNHHFLKVTNHVLGVVATLLESSVISIPISVSYALEPNPQLALTLLYFVKRTVLPYLTSSSMNHNNNGTTKVAATKFLIESFSIIFSLFRIWNYRRKLLQSKEQLFFGTNSSASSTSTTSSRKQNFQQREQRKLEKKLSLLSSQEGKLFSFSSLIEDDCDRVFMSQISSEVFMLANDVMKVLNTMSPPFFVGKQQQQQSQKHSPNTSSASTTSSSLEYFVETEISSSVTTCLPFNNNNDNTVSSQKSSTIAANHFASHLFLQCYLHSCYVISSTFNNNSNNSNNNSSLFSRVVASFEQQNGKKLQLGLDFLKETNNTSTSNSNTNNNEISTFNHGVVRILEYFSEELASGRTCSKTACHVMLPGITEIVSRTNYHLREKLDQQFVLHKLKALLSTSPQLNPSALLLQISAASSSSSSSSGKKLLPLKVPKFISESVTQEVILVCELLYLHFVIMMENLKVKQQQQTKTKNHKNMDDDECHPFSIADSFEELKFLVTALIRCLFCLRYSFAFPKRVSEVFAETCKMFSKCFRFLVSMEDDYLLLLLQQQSENQNDDEEEEETNPMLNPIQRRRIAIAGLLRSLFEEAAKWNDAEESCEICEEDSDENENEVYKNKTTKTKNNNDNISSKGFEYVISSLLISLVAEQNELKEEENTKEEEENGYHENNNIKSEIFESVKMISKSLKKFCVAEIIKHPSSTSSATPSSFIMNLIFISISFSTQPRTIFSGRILVLASELSSSPEICLVSSSTTTSQKRILRPELLELLQLVSKQQQESQEQEETQNIISSICFFKILDNLANFLIGPKIVKEAEEQQDDDNEEEEDVELKKNFPSSNSQFHFPPLSLKLKNSKRIQFETLLTLFENKIIIQQQQYSSSSSSVCSTTQQEIQYFVVVAAESLIALFIGNEQQQYHSSSSVNIDFFLKMTEQISSSVAKVEKDKTTTTIASSSSSAMTKKSSTKEKYDVFSANLSSSSNSTSAAAAVATATTKTTATTISSRQKKSIKTITNHDLVLLNSLRPESEKLSAADASSSHHETSTSSSSSLSKSSSLLPLFFDMFSFEYCCQTLNRLQKLILKIRNNQQKQKQQENGEGEQEHNLIKNNYFELRLHRTYSKIIGVLQDSLPLLLLFGSNYFSGEEEVTSLSNSSSQQQMLREMNNIVMMIEKQQEQEDVNDNYRRKEVLFREQKYSNKNDSNSTENTSRMMWYAVESDDDDEDTENLGEDYNKNVIMSEESKHQQHETTSFTIGDVFRVDVNLMPTEGGNQIQQNAVLSIKIDNESNGLFKTNQQQQQQQQVRKQKKHHQHHLSQSEIEEAELTASKVIVAFSVEVFVSTTSQQQRRRQRVCCFAREVAPPTSLFSNHQHHKNKLHQQHHRQRVFESLFIPTTPSTSSFSSFENNNNVLEVSISIFSRSSLDPAVEVLFSALNSLKPQNSVTTSSSVQETKQENKEEEKDKEEHNGDNNKNENEEEEGDFSTDSSDFTVIPSPVKHLRRIEQESLPMVRGASRYSGALHRAFIDSTSSSSSSSSRSLLMKSNNNNVVKENYFQTKTTIIAPNSPSVKVDSGSCVLNF